MLIGKDVAYAVKAFSSWTIDSLACLSYQRFVYSAACQPADRSRRTQPMFASRVLSCLRSRSLEYHLHTGHFYSHYR